MPSEASDTTAVVTEIYYHELQKVLNCIFFRWYLGKQGIDECAEVAYTEH